MEKIIELFKFSSYNKMRQKERKEERKADSARANSAVIVKLIYFAHSVSLRSFLNHIST